MRSNCFYIMNRILIVLFIFAFSSLRVYGSERDVYYYAKVDDVVFQSSTESGVASDILVANSWHSFEIIGVYSTYTLYRFFRTPKELETPSRAKSVSISKRECWTDEVFDTSVNACVVLDEPSVCESGLDDYRKAYRVGNNEINPRPSVCNSSCQYVFSSMNPVAMGVPGKPDVFSHTITYISNGLSCEGTTPDEVEPDQPEPEPEEPDNECSDSDLDDELCEPEEPDTGPGGDGTGSGGGGTEGGDGDGTGSGGGGTEGGDGDGTGSGGGGTEGGDGDGTGSGGGGTGGGDGNGTGSVGGTGGGDGNGTGSGGGTGGGDGNGTGSGGGTGGGDGSGSGGDGEEGGGGEGTPVDGCEGENCSFSERDIFGGDVPSFSDSFRIINDGISNSPIGQSIDSIRFPTGGVCPTGVYTVDLGVTNAVLRFDSHCELWEKSSVPLRAAFLAAWALLAVRVFLSA